MFKALAHLLAKLTATWPCGPARPRHL